MRIIYSNDTKMNAMYINECNIYHTNAMRICVLSYLGRTSTGYSVTTPFIATTVATDP